MNGTYEHIVLGAGQEIIGRWYYRWYRQSMELGEVP